MENIILYFLPYTKSIHNTYGMNEYGHMVQQTYMST